MGNWRYNPYKWSCIYNLQLVWGPPCIYPVIPSIQGFHGVSSVCFWGPTTKPQKVARDV